MPQIHNMLQALPCSLAQIEASPNLKEDHCMGIILATYPLIYQAFNNTVAAGKYTYASHYDSTTQPRGLNALILDLT